MPPAARILQFSTTRGGPGTLIAVTSRGFSGYSSPQAIRAAKLFFAPRIFGSTNRKPKNRIGKNPNLKVRNCQINSRINVVVTIQGFILPYNVLAKRRALARPSGGEAGAA